MQKRSYTHGFEQVCAGRLCVQECEALARIMVCCGLSKLAEYLVLLRAPFVTHDMG